MWPLLAAGTVRPVIHATFPLARAADAHRMMEASEHIGKIVLEVRDGRRTLISSGSTFERDIGYSRAVVQGDWVFVSGTTGFDYATMTIAEGLEAQAEQCLKNIEAALTQAGASFADVVRVHYILPDAPRSSRSAGRCCGSTSARSRPAATMIAAGLADPRMRIEIEVTALRQRRRPGRGDRPPRTLYTVRFPMPPSDRLFTSRFVVMCGFNFVVFLSAFQLLPTAPFQIRALGGSAAAAGLFLGFLTYSSAMSGPITGGIVDRVGKRRVLVTSSVALAGVRGRSTRCCRPTRRCWRWSSCTASSGRGCWSPPART